MSKLNVPAKGEKTKEQPSVEKKAENKKTTVVDVLFPEREVELADGTIILVTPLKLKDLPKISESFGTLMGYAGLGATPPEIASRAFTELARLIPYSIDGDQSKIPASAGPEIIGHIIDLNVTEEVIKKWTALVEKMLEAAAGSGLALDQGDEKQNGKS